MSERNFGDMVENNIIYLRFINLLGVSENYGESLNFKKLITVIHTWIRIMG